MGGSSTTSRGRAKMTPRRRTYPVLGPSKRRKEGQSFPNPHRPGMTRPRHTPPRPRGPLDGPLRRGKGPTSSRRREEMCTPPTPRHPGMTPLRHVPPRSRGPLDGPRRRGDGWRLAKDQDPRSRRTCEAGGCQMSGALDPYLPGHPLSEWAPLPLEQVLGQ